MDAASFLLYTLPVLLLLITVICGFRLPFTFTLPSLHDCIVYILVAAHSSIVYLCWFFTRVAEIIYWRIYSGNLWDVNGPEADDDDDEEHEEALKIPGGRIWTDEKKRRRMARQLKAKENIKMSQEDDKKEQKEDERMSRSLDRSPSRKGAINLRPRVGRSPLSQVFTMHGSSSPSRDDICPSIPSRASPPTPYPTGVGIEHLPPPTPYLNPVDINEGSLSPPGDDFFPPIDALSADGSAPITPNTSLLSASSGQSRSPSPLIQKAARMQIADSKQYRQTTNEHAYIRTSPGSEPGFLDNYVGISDWQKGLVSKPGEVYQAKQEGKAAEAEVVKTEVPEGDQLE